MCSIKLFYSPYNSFLRVLCLVNNVFRVRSVFITDVRWCQVVKADSGNKKEYVIFDVGLPVKFFLEQYKLSWKAFKACVLYVHICPTLPTGVVLTLFQAKSLEFVVRLTIEIILENLMSKHFDFFVNLIIFSAVDRNFPNVIFSAKSFSHCPVL